MVLCVNSVEHKETNDSNLSKKFLEDKRMTDFICRLR